MAVQGCPVYGLVVCDMQVPLAAQKTESMCDKWYQLDCPYVATTHVHAASCHAS